MNASTPYDALFDDDSEALFAVATHGGALATVTKIEGSWSRRLGAQLAILPDGTTRGSLADGCLERALAAEAIGATAPKLLRYGAGSPFVDIRLPCGSGIDVWLDPAPDKVKIAQAVTELSARRPATLTLVNGFIRNYHPKLRLVILGSGPEVRALAELADAQAITVIRAAPSEEMGGIALGLGQIPDITIDPWTAIAVLFHDHEWERAILPWALGSGAFYVGAQGGAGARENRQTALREAGLSAGQLHRLKSPIGLFTSARSPRVLALSVLAEIVAGYEGIVG
jgi:xanthine dehydrogenase accessory factor